ncbi:hypothetical protein, partial [Mycobacterium marinum]|uniref:hypothetical protein n=1 Tax=Mycobacterium marinum TaxID=1781 RepID=UPI001CA524D0
MAASNSSKTSVTRLTTGLSSFARSPRNPLSGGGAHAGERDESDRVGHGRFLRHGAEFFFGGGHRVHYLPDPFWHARPRLAEP